MAMIAHRIYGANIGHEFSRVSKAFKQEAKVHSHDLYRMISHGEVLPNVEFGQIVRIVPNVGGKKILAIATRFGPISMLAWKTEVQCYMNHHLTPYLMKKPADLHARPFVSPLMQFLGYEDRDRNLIYYNLGEFVELMEKRD
jgi:hypothetical protein